MVPHPNEYDSVNFELMEVMKWFAVLYFCAFLPLVALQQETLRPGGSMNRLIKKQIYGEKPLLDYLASNPLKRPWNNGTAECEWNTTMTNKDFY